VAIVADASIEIRCFKFFDVATASRSLSSRVLVALVAVRLRVSGVRPK
jgi:hypothetical protein